MTSAKDMPTPGFVFNPTDQQLVNFYLRQKICGNDIKVSAIAEIDNICNYEPSDLPELAVMRSKDTWHFFNPPDRKYRNSGHNNRLTRRGYWKVTGPIREIKNAAKNQVIGFKRILVFHRGRVGDKLRSRTNWVIHEYYLSPSDSNGKDYVISRLHLRPPKKTANSAVDAGKPGYDSASEVENLVTVTTFPERDPQFMKESLNSSEEDFNSLTTLQEEMHVDLGQTYVNFQDANGFTYDYIVPLSQDGISDQQYKSTDSVQSPDIQNVQYYSGSMHPAHDDSSASESSGSLHTGNTSDTEAVCGSLEFLNSNLPEMHMSQDPIYANQHICGITDDYNIMPFSQFGASDQRDSNREAMKLNPAIQDVQYYFGSGNTSPYYFSPSESWDGLHKGNISNTEAVKARVDGCLPEMHLMEGLSYENLQQTNGLNDEYKLLLSSFGAIGQQDNNSELLKSYPAIQNVPTYCGSIHIAAGNSDTEAVNNPLLDYNVETALLGDGGRILYRSFEPASAYFSQT